MSANVEARLAYRFFATDDSQSAGSSTAVGTAVKGPGKVFKSAGTINGGGLKIQLGIELKMSSGTSTGRAWLRYPIAVTK